MVCMYLCNVCVWVYMCTLMNMYICECIFVCMCVVCVCEWMYACVYVVYVCTHLLKGRAEVTSSLAPSVLHCTMHYTEQVFGRSVHLIALTAWVLALMEWKEIAFMLNWQIPVTMIKKGAEELLSEQDSHHRFLCEVPPDCLWRNSEVHHGPLCQGTQLDF